ncbi:hypothetical protein FRB97_007008 [Tulasnella sp. 331]|nr:hypothetical protein FRB97_007008 [Tulasnella sp. 331]KAG8882984.1 hypothetical protein FRB98_003363 [Tulasnella sp. 332]
MITTQLTQALGITVPVVQGGMQWVGLPKLVAAVSNAGGLGILTALTQPSPEALREAIRKTRTMTSKPFGVNITILPTITPPDYEGYARAAIAEGVKIFETAGNNRAGHPGEEDIPGIILLARAANELNVPYLASGGFADGRGLVAALSLGASGINCGTRFMCTEESEIHPNIKQKIIDSTEQDTIHIFRTLNNTARVFKNKVSTEVVRLERRPGGAKFEELRELVSGARGRLVYENGDPDYGIWSAGLAVGLINDAPSCEVLLRRIEKEAEDGIGNLSNLVSLKQKAKL